MSTERCANEVKSRRKVSITNSSGDVYRDLGINLSDEDRYKIDIAKQITVLIKRSNLTQKDVAEILGTTQARVSDLTRGRLETFSIRKLIGFLINIGCDVDVRVSPKNDGRKGIFSVRIDQAA